MVDLHTYVLFIGAVVVLVLAPGPDMAYMLARTLDQGRRAGVLAALGINSGAYVHVTAAVLGLTAIFFLAFLPQFIDVESRHATVSQQLLLLGVTCNVVAICINLVNERL